MVPLLGVAGLVLVVDQLSKFIVRYSLEPGQSMPVIKGLFYLTYVRNTGAAFGLFSNRRPVFVAATFLAIIMILVYHLKTKETTAFFNVALGLELGGAIGNLIDRLTHGWVTDFIYVRFIPVFNIADSAIVVGVILLILIMLQDIVKERNESKTDASDTV